MIDIGMMYAMAALPLAVESGSSTGLMIGVAVASFAVGAIVFSLIFRRKVAIDSNLAENARKEAEAIKAEAEKDGKEIQPVHPKGDQCWVFIGRTDAEAETPVLRSEERR